MPKYDTELLIEILNAASVSFKIKSSPREASASRPTSDIKISGYIEGNVYTEGIPQGVVAIGSFSVVRSGFSVAKTSIGRFCSIGPNVQFGSPEHVTTWLSTSSAFKNDYPWTKDKREFSLSRDAINYKATTVGNDVWIGRGAFIKSGITIGDGAVIGASAVVTKNVPPYAIVAGNPARIIKYRFPEQIVEKLTQLKWWELDPAWIAQVDYKDIVQCLSYLDENIHRLPSFEPRIVQFSDSEVMLKNNGKIVLSYAAMKRSQEE